MITKQELWEQQIKPTDKVLDIGCWSGKRLKNYFNSYGLEIDQSKIDLALPYIKMRIKQGDVCEGIPFKQKFDYIFLIDVLEHVSNDCSALDNISNSLKKGGHLILSTPREIKGFDFYDPAWIRWKLFNGGQHIHFTKYDLFSTLEFFSFKVEEHYTKGNFVWLTIRWLNVFLRYVLKSNKQIAYPMGNGFFNWVILARKK